MGSHAVPSRIVLQSLQKLRDSDGLMLMDEFAVPAKVVVSVSQDFDNYCSQQNRQYFHLGWIFNLRQLYFRYNNSFGPCRYKNVTSTCYWLEHEIKYNMDVGKFPPNVGVWRNP